LERQCSTDAGQGRAGLLQHTARSWPPVAAPAAIHPTEHGSTSKAADGSASLLLAAHIYDLAHEQQQQWSSAALEHALKELQLWSIGP